MRPTDLEIEMYLVGDLDAEAAGRIDAAAHDDAALARHLAARRADQEAFKLSRPRLTFDAAPNTPQRLVRRWANLFAPAGLLTATAAVLVTLSVVQPSPGPSSSGVHARGNALVASVIVRRDAAVFRLTEATPLRPGDLVRIEVSLEAPRACSAIGVDAQGHITSLYDREPLTAGKAIFPRSLSLDDSVGAEQIIVGCDVDAATLTAAIAPQGRGLDALNIPLALIAYDKEPAAGESPR